MIVIRVELWSAVNGQVSELARMTIDNIGGTTNLGDYRVRTLRGRSQEALDKAMLTNGVQREGQVLRHPRLREHVWNLVAKALATLRYGPAAPPDITIEPSFLKIDVSSLAELLSVSNASGEDN